jgi:hypothetical protein
MADHAELAPAIEDFPGRLSVAAVTPAVGLDGRFREVELAHAHFSNLFDLDFPEPQHELALDDVIRGAKTLGVLYV